MRFSALVLLLAAAFAQPALPPQQQGTAASLPAVIPVDGAVNGTHDPSIARDGDIYYVFATGKAPGGQIPIRCSPDLRAWTLCGHLFDTIPAWIRAASPGTRDLWAPDVSFTQGEFRLYYAYSLFGKRTSGIALATTRTLNPDSPGYGWVDKGLVLATTEADDFNAIDPAFAEDGKGGDWLVFGSFWSGIKLRSLDPATGLLSAKDRKLYSLARRQGGPEGSAVEAPYIVAHDGRFFLFVSFGQCCKGAKSTYRIMVGSARKITGPYRDASGRRMMDGGGTELLVGNGAWAGPGGQSVLHDRDGRDLIVFHAYDATTGRPRLQISTIAWVHGWPQIALAGGQTLSPAPSN